MDGMINRQKLIEAVEKSTMIDVFDPYRGGFDDCIKLETVVELINSQPPADQWIPCSERLPNDEQKTFITAQLQGGDKFTSHATYHAEKPVYWPSSNWVGAGFYSYDSEYGECKYENVIAWMPAEPYTGE